MAKSSNIKARDVVKGVFSSFAPVTMNSIDSARSVASDVRTIGRKVSTGMRQNMAQIDKSHPGRRAIALFNAAKDALTDGTYEINQVNEDMYDDFEDYDSNFTLDDMTDDERASTSPEEIILKGNKGIAQSVIRASTAQLEGMDAVSNKILRGTLRASEASTKSINATIIYSTNILTTQLGTMNNKLDTINENLVNLINYQNENTTRYYEKNLELMDSMLNSMTNLTAMSQGKGARDLKNFDVRNGFNIKEYLNRVKKGIKDSTLISGTGMIGSAVNLAKDNPDIMSIGELIGNGIAAMVADMIPGINAKTSRITKIDRRVSQYMNEALYKIGDKLSSNLVASVLGLDSLGNRRRRNYGIDMSNYMKDQLPWNGKAQKALTEVIPELLTSIDAGINNTDKRYFDYDQGYFKSRKEIEKDFADQISTSISLEFSDMMDKLGKKFNLSGKSPEEINAAKDKISNTINKRIYGEGDITAARQDIAHILQEMNLSANEFSSVFNNIEEAISSVTEQIAEVYSRIGSTDSIYRAINNRSGATSKKAIGREAFRILKEHRTSGKEDTSLFRSSISTDVKDTIDRINKELKAEIPEFKMTKEYEQYINMAVRRGDADYEIIRAVKNTFGSQNFFEIAKQKVYKLLGKHYTVEILDENADDIDLGKVGNAVDMSLLQKAYGIKTKYSDIKSESAGIYAAHEINKEARKMAKENKKTKSKSRSKKGVSDTTYTNKAASSQRSRMDGKSAGAEAAHDKRSTNDGISFEYPIDQETEDLKDAMTNEASKSYDKMINSDENSLNNGEKLRDSVSKTISDIGKNGSTSFGGALKNAIDTMVLSMGSMISSFTSFGSRLFGKEGIIKNFFKSDEFKAGMNKIKDFLIGDENGIFKDQWAKLKKFGRNTWEKTKDKLTDAYDWVYRNYSTYKYGEEYEKNEDWQNNELMQKLNLKKRREEKKAMLAAQQAEEKASQRSSLKSSENKIEPETLTTSTGKVIHKNAAGKWVDSNNKFVSNAEVSDAKKTSNTAAITETKSTTSEIQNVTEKITSNDKNKGGKSSVQEIQKAANDATEEATKELKSSVQKIADAGEESAKELKESTEKFTTAVVGDPKEKPEDIKKKYSKSFSDKLKSVLPKVGAGAIIGAGVGFLNGVGGHSLLGSLFLPTGLIGGAIVGGGLTILSQTEAFKSLMFGKKDKNGERTGGLISKNLKEKFKKAAPIAVGGAVTGAISSILKMPLTGGKGLGILGMQLLPGGILGGAIMGMGVGLLKNSDFFQNLVFGKKNEKGERSGTWLSKSFNKMKDKMAGTSTYIKNAIKGGVIGTISGATLANMGVLPAAISAGPIGMGIAGLGIGIASSTKKFQDWLFGTEELDENGNSLGRKGGFLGRVKNLISANVVEPISYSFRKNMVKLIDWTKDKITLPFRTAFGPILDSIKGIKDNVVEFVQDKFEDIGNGITDMIKNTLGKLFSPITSLIGKVGSALLGGARVGLQIAAAPLTAGLQAMNVLTMGKRRKEYKAYRKAYLAQEANGGMTNTLKEYWNRKSQDGQKVGFFDKVSDTINAYMGKGEIAESFRKGYVQEMKDQGKDSLDWLTAQDDKKQLRNDRKQHNKAFKKWDDINNYGRKLANEFGGREVELTPKMFEKYKKKFVDKGIDASLINDSADIMDLIYRPSQFKKKAAGDTGRLGELEALKKYRLTDEERAHMATTEKYQSNVEKYLKDISESGKATAEELMFDRSMTTYTEDRKRDTKRLRNKLKKAYKSSLWEGRRAIDLNSPTLYEYDIEGISDEDLQDYAASNFADNNDFEGYLASIGRKMSPDDDRVAYHSAIRKNGLWKRTTGKTSEEKPPESKPDTSDATQAAVVEELKKTREIQEASLELQSGGDVTADDVKKNNYKDFGKRKVAKYSIFGALNNIFNRKSKEDKENAQKAKEAEEQKQATALGDEPNTTDENKSNENATINGAPQTEKKKSWFSKLFGGIGMAFGLFGASKVGKIIKTGVKTLGTIGLLGGIGLTIAELIKPGTANSIGAAITDWNNETLQAAKDGTFIETLKEKVSGWFTSIGTFMNEKVLSKDGYLRQATNKVAEIAPAFMNNFMLPAITKSANFVAENAETLVGAAGTVITAIAPPLAEAVAKVIPSVVISLGKGFWNNLWGKNATENGKENLTESQKNAIIESGGSYQTKWNTVTEEEAQKAANNGQEVKQNDDGTWSVRNDYTLDSNQYVDKNGNIQTRTKQGILGRFANLGARFGINALTGRGATNAKLAKFAGKTVAKGGMSVLGGTLGITGGLPGMITGAATGWKTGAKIAEKVEPLGNKIKSGVTSLFSKFGKKTAVETAGAVVTESTDDVAKALVEAAGKSAGTGISDVAKVAAKESDNFLQKIIKVIKNIPNNTTIKNMVEKISKSKATEVLAGISKWIDDLTKKLLEASAEITKGTPIGKKISKLLAEKSAVAGTKSSVALATALLSDVAFVSIGAISGAVNAANLFEVSSNEVNFKMRLIAGILNGLLNTSIGSYVDIAMLVLELFTGFDARKWCASLLYKYISFDSEASEEKLSAAQDELAIETALYNQATGSNMTVSEYNDVTNKGFFGKLWDKVTNKSVDTSSYKKQASEIAKSGNYSKDKNGNIVLNNVGNGTGAVGYGPGMNSQANSAWANMPIGRFSNGKVSTMKTGGCGPTALSTIANMFGKGNINPGTVGAYAAKNGYITDGGANENLFTKGAAGLGLIGGKISKDNFDRAVSNAPMAISGKNSGPFTKAGHVVVSNGIDRNGNINIIDPMDGKSKKYSKDTIKSGMTNAWAYTNKPIGYGPSEEDTTNNSIVKKITKFIKYNATGAIVDNLETVQTALSNIPQIMMVGMESVFNTLPKAIVTPIAIPIQYAVESIGVIGKLLSGEDISNEDVVAATNSSSMISKMSNSIKNTFKGKKVSTTTLSTTAMKNTTKTVSGNKTIGSSLKNLWNKITGKSKNTGYGHGPVGYGVDPISLIPSINMPMTPSQKAMQEASRVNSGKAGPVSYDYIKQTNQKAMESLGIDAQKAEEASTNIANNVWKNKTGKSYTNTVSSSNISNNTNTTTTNNNAAINYDDGLTNYEGIDDNVTIADHIGELKLAMSTAPESLSGLIGGFKKFGNMIKAVLGVIKGEGDFNYLYNKLADSEYSEDDNLSGSGQYTTFDDKNMSQQTKIWNYFLNQDYEKNAIAGIMGAWQTESSNKALRVEGDYLPKAKEIGVNNILASPSSLDNYTTGILFPAYKNSGKRIDKGTYYWNGHYYPGLGLAQWTGSRAYNLRKYAAENNSDWRNLKTQLEFANKELTEKYYLKNKLNKAPSPEEAAKIVASKYEGNTSKLAQQKAAARSWYNEYYNIVKADRSTLRSGRSSGRVNNGINQNGEYKGSTVYGYGPIGFGPDDGPSNLSELMSGYNSATDYLKSKLNDMGIGELFNFDSGTGDTYNGVTFDSSMWSNSPDQMKPVNAMKSIYGKVHYSLGGSQNPENGSASCASTVAWAYNKALGVNGMSSSSTTQSKDNRFTTIWTNNGSGLTEDFINKYMHPGDIVYQNWDRTSNNGQMKHTEMYAGDGKTLSHGGPKWSDMGPVYKDLLSDSRKKHTMMIRRYNGFMNNSNTGYGEGPSTEDKLTMDNNFIKDISTKRPSTSKKLSGHEGDVNTGYGLGGDTTNLEERLDKIFNIITEWYLMEKKAYAGNKGYGNGSGSNVTNNTVVNNSTKVVKENEKKTVQFNSNLEKLTEKHSTFARMYKTSI